MLRLALVLVGAALILRSRRRKSSSPEQEDSSGDPGSDFAPSGGMPRPTLDPGVLAAMPPGTPNPFAHVIPPPDFGGQPVDTLINPPPMPTTVGTGGPPTRAQLSSAWNMWNAIIGSLPEAIRIKIENIKRLSAFQGRVFTQPIGSGLTSPVPGIGFGGHDPGYVAPNPLSYYRR